LKSRVQAFEVPSASVNAAVVWPYIQQHISHSKLPSIPSDRLLPNDAPVLQQLQVAFQALSDITTVSQFYQCWLSLIMLNTHSEEGSAIINSDRSIHLAPRMRILSLFLFHPTLLCFILSDHGHFFSLSDVMRLKYTWLKNHFISLISDCYVQHRETKKMICGTRLQEIIAGINQRERQRHSVEVSGAQQQQSEQPPNQARHNLRPRDPLITYADSEREEEEPPRQR
jgi:hypothetical protein